MPALMMCTVIGHVHDMCHTNAFQLMVSSGTSHAADVQFVHHLAIEASSQSAYWILTHFRLQIKTLSIVGLLHPGLVFAFPMIEQSRVTLTNH